MTSLPKISAPATRALNARGVFTLEQAEQLSDAELLALHGFGDKGLRILKAAIADRNQANTALPGDDGQ
ncbi:DNA-binding protein [Lysinibacter cavernae]|uniref:DNA-binding protein n=1 Tax=Lysinibacter cavernae TaxID=1640652 RepID=A0A7X5R4C9_9MICO|nr:DNA-binding protein [Lysinibacter cavernae]NIH55347.1 hypothetical protein [Lysinibacter cavernae]